MKNTKHRKNKKHRKQKTKKFRKEKCSPTVENNSDFTCYDKKTIMKMRHLWNLKYPNNPIQSSSPIEIWNFLRNNLENKCTKESCWLRQNFMKSGLDKKLLNYTFAPEMPHSWLKNPHEWLTSNDISNVMQQYEKKYPYFKFIGPSPIDFDTRLHHGECVWEELCKFNLKREIGQGIMFVGMVFNTDPHHKDGSHWISLVINVKKKIICFFDSTGYKIPKEVQTFVDRVITQGQKHNIEFKYDDTENIEHQKGGTECGMYSLYFIIYMLEHGDFNHFKNKRLGDDYVFKYREKLFNFPV